MAQPDSKRETGRMDPSPPGVEVPGAPESAPVSSDRAEPSERGKSVRGPVLGMLITLRPHQWVKNAFVLAPVVFAKEIFDHQLLLRAGGAFAIFCLLAGAIYTVNDIADYEADRQHPVKRHRPIASGQVSISGARATAAILMLLCLGGAFWLSPPFGVVALAYFGLNLAYSLKLKHVAYLDVGCISAGFVFRVLGGGLATETPISNYLLLCTALLALFLGFGKRRHELTAASGRAGKQRAALESYTRRGLDVALLVTSVLTLATYVAYTLDPRTRELFGSDWLWPSSLFVLLGEIRFFQLVTSRPRAESPTQEMLKDGPFVAIVVAWVILVMWIVYKFRPG
jgi:decaprenyl-phosphate phosphoribosyltransferase